MPRRKKSEEIEEATQAVEKSAQANPSAKPAPRPRPTPEQLQEWVVIQRERVEAILARFAEHNWDIGYATSVIPHSAAFLLRALVEEGRLDRYEMQYRQLVIQETLLNVEFKNRTIRADEEALSIPRLQPPLTLKPRISGASGLVLPSSARRPKN